MQLDRPLLVVTPTVDGDVLMALARADASFTGRGLHQVIGRYSAEGVRRALERLVSQGIVNASVAGPSKLYRLNRQHVAAPHVVALAGIAGDFCARLRDRIAAWQIPPAYAALFGSAVTGQMRPDSDIDVFAVRPETIAMDDHGWVRQLEELAHDGTLWTGNDLRILEMSEADARMGAKGNDPVIADIRDQGIVLAGPTEYLAARAAKAPRGAG
ncbi:MAG TPA: nucleotidyltransferase domain-containing protein [Streptosporangiaceae bacterium]|jgi:hypothetical protein